MKVAAERGVEDNQPLAGWRKLGEHARPQDVVEGAHPIDGQHSGLPWSAPVAARKMRARHSVPARVDKGPSVLKVLRECG